MPTSPIMDALYNGRRDEAEALAAEAGALDVFEAASLGRLEDVAGAPGRRRGRRRGLVR